MKTVGAILLSFCSFFLFGAFSVNGQTVTGQISFNSITRHEIDILIADVAATNPAAVEKLADPEARKKQIENLKQLLAVASQALKDGMVSDPANRQKMDSIRIEYEQKLRTDSLTKESIELTNLKVKLRQAQFLAELYFDKVIDQLMATDQEVAAYIKTHQGLSKKDARSKVEEDKAQRLYEKLIKSNNVKVPDDFTLPPIK